jgi:hypothetical protein
MRGGISAARAGRPDPPDSHRRRPRAGATGCPRSPRLDGRLGKVAAMLEDAEEQILAFYAFPVDHWRRLDRQIRSSASTAKIGRRKDIVGIVPYETP